jgi:hypothetical protein
VKVLADPVFEAIASGKTTALWGGNELADSFSSDWMQADGTIGGDIYVHASGGPNYSANFRPQHKITRYRRNESGGYDLVWRVGRTQLPGSAKVRGQIAGGMRMFKPINGILAVIDQSRSGVFLYTEDGIYVDTLFAGDAGDGVYVQPGEFFVGSVFANRDNGKIYYGSGKYTPFIYEIEGWDLKTNPFKPLQVAKKTCTITLTAAKTADPPREALRIRKALGTDLVAEFAPLAVGWDGVTPVVFSDDGDTVEVFDPWYCELPPVFEGLGEIRCVGVTPVDDRPFSCNRLVERWVFEEPQGTAYSLNAMCGRDAVVLWRADGR